MWIGDEWVRVHLFVASRSFSRRILFVSLRHVWAGRAACGSDSLLLPEQADAMAAALPVSFHGPADSSVASFLRRNGMGIARVDSREHQRSTSR